MNDYPLVYIVLVNYNGYELTKDCLVSLDAIKYINSKIIVIDNASTDSSAEKLSEMEGIDFIANGTNDGFVGGNNIGIKFALERGAKYILLLNNDTIVEPDFLNELVLAMETDQKIGVTGCKIMNYYDKDRVWSAGGGICKWTKKTFQYGEGKRDDGSYDEAREVDFLSGCCLLIRREVIEKIGLLDNDYFMYYEDVDYCLRTKKAGFTVNYVPESVIWHKIGGSSNKSFMDYYRMRNFVLYLKKNYNFNQYNLYIILFLTVMERLIRIILRGVINTKSDNIKNRIYSLLNGFSTGMRTKKS